MEVALIHLNNVIDEYQDARQPRVKNIDDWSRAWLESRAMVLQDLAAIGISAADVNALTAMEWQSVSAPGKQRIAAFIQTMTLHSVKQV